MSVTQHFSITMTKIAASNDPTMSESVRGVLDNRGMLPKSKRDFARKVGHGAIIVGSAPLAYHAYQKAAQPVVEKLMSKAHLAKNPTFRAVMRRGGPLAAASLASIASGLTMAQWEAMRRAR